MTSINGLGSNLLDAYEKFQSYKSELTTENMFQMLSVEIGGDGETITKDQLNAYIEDAEDGTVEINESEFEALKLMQDNWDTIAGEGAESITYEEMEDYTGILLTAVTGGISAPSSNSGDSNYSYVEDIDAYLLESLGDSYNYDSASGLSSLLQTLLTGTTDEEDDINADLIATITNMIVESTASNSTIELEA